jgi:hypothetical protein
MRVSATLDTGGRWQTGGGTCAWWIGLRYHTHCTIMTFLMFCLMYPISGLLFATLLFPESLIFFLLLLTHSVSLFSCSAMGSGGFGFALESLMSL